MLLHRSESKVLEVWSSPVAFVVVEPKIRGSLRKLFLQDLGPWVLSPPAKPHDTHKHRALVFEIFAFEQDSYQVEFAGHRRLLPLQLPFRMR